MDNVSLPSTWSYGLRIVHDAFSSLYNVGIILCNYVTKGSKYKIIAPTEILMAPQIEKWPHIFSTSGVIVPTTSFAFLGPAYGNQFLEIMLWQYCNTMFSIGQSYKHSY